MKKIIYFNYCAFFIFFILLISTLFQKMTKGRKNHYYLAMLVTSLISVAADVIAVQLDKFGPGNVVAKYIFHTAFLLSHNLISPLYMVYLIARTDTWHKLKWSKLLKGALYIPIFTVMLALLTNPLTKIMFYFDGNDTYTRGSCFLLLHIVAIFYVFFGTIYLWHYRKLFNKVSFISLMSVIPFIMIASIIQLFFPWCIVELFATSCGLLFISMMVQRPEDTIDITTGLGRDSAYIDDLQRAFANEKPMQIIMINISNYGAIFDMLGLSGLNKLFKIVADRLIELDKTEHMQSSIYNLGNGKFSMVVDFRNFDKVEKTANKLNDIMKKDFIVNQMELNLISYICVVKCPQDITDLNLLLAFENDLSKKPYTGDVMYASDVYKKEYYDIMTEIDTIIDHALANHKFNVYYQPIYSVTEQRFNSAEALLRLNDDKYGFISPELFIPAAEKSGAIHKIGAYVLEEVCSFIASDEYKSLGLDYIEINLSVSQCMQNNLANEVLDTLNKYHVSTDQINLEITETAASDSQKIMNENLDILNKAGVHFSLDDFGTGYSNIKRIASLPLDIIKLDKSFTKLEENPKLQIILQNTINMIKDMDMKIVVEGVETEELVKYFSHLECEYIQGYYYSKPIPKNDFVTFIRASIQ